MKTEKKKPRATKSRRKAALPVVHFEIIGEDPSQLRSYYGKLFGWKSTTSPTAKEISEPGKYGFIDLIKTEEGVGLRGGIGGGRTFAPHAIFYIGVPDVEKALKAAEKLGGKRQLGPVVNPATHVAVGHFLDPAGNLVGVAGPAK